MLSWSSRVGYIFAREGRYRDILVLIQTNLQVVMSLNTTSPAASAVTLPLSDAGDTTPSSSTTALIAKNNQTSASNQPGSSSSGGGSPAAKSKQAAPPKNFEAAFGTLSASYGWGMGSDTQRPRSAKPPKAKQDRRAKPGSGSSSKPKSSPT
ncbi:uncharacterized protein C8Q71DRAFT_741780 [Rhodofomes roseus]|uniref:Uncharacterized protein n=1 Tax=Rhodofomes roseus TaxID=34475 RepID=A0ABQ8KR82_9APHY|nr:uncharacterized protein C8Q71DRAFT_741780 [Rhodofomes roseus]KAH9840854.1 hypothetical protein C8Q71DRAFT_741780 [Rhodofomes roseus]